jgi:hypothetical protein
MKTETEMRERIADEEAHKSLALEAANRAAANGNWSLCCSLVNSAMLAQTWQAALRWVLNEEQP